MSACCAAERGGYRRRIEVIGGDRAVAKMLLDMAMAVDATRQYKHPSSIDLLLATLQMLAKCDDAATGDCDVATGDIAGIGDSAPANDELIG